MNQSEFSNDPKTLKSHMKAYAKKNCLKIPEKMVDIFVVLCSNELYLYLFV